MEGSEAGEPTEQGALLAVLAHLPAVAAGIAEIRTHLFHAEVAAKAHGRPIDELRRLADDLDAIRELLEEKAPETVQRLAEAGSWG